MLLCVLDHPTQYDPPLWRAMAHHTALEPNVWYVEARAPHDPELRAAVDWTGAFGGYVQRHVPLTQLANSLRNASPQPQAILLSGWTRPAARIVWPVARALGVPIVLATDKTLNERSPGGAGGHAYTLLHSARARAFDAFFTTGLLGTQYLASIGCAYERIATGLYPVELAFWQERMAACAELSRSLRASIPEAAFHLIAVCKLSEREDPMTLLEAFAAFVRKHPNAYFTQVGDGPLRPQFEARVRALGVEKQVRLAGYVPYNQLAGYYGAADAFAHVPAREPWGLSVLEAMACGVPVLAATTVGAAADLVAHGRTGALAYAGDAPSMTEGLEVIARDAPRMARAARAAIERFDVVPVARGLADLVARLDQPLPRAAPPWSVLYSDLRNEFGRWSR